MTALASAQTEALRAFAGTMIPASAEHGVPGADDALIFADMTRDLGRDRDDVIAALARLDALAGADYANLPPARRLETANQFRAEGGAPLAAIVRVVLLAYYRDDRVMLSLGQEPRPPFPKGHVVEQGDWELLAPVKARAPFWRKVR
jgi:hypothetical protein